MACNTLPYRIAALLATHRPPLVRQAPSHELQYLLLPGANPICLRLYRGPYPLPHFGVNSELRRSLVIA
jgi:hypothetical protein